MIIKIITIRFSSEKNYDYALEPWGVYIFRNKDNWLKTVKKISTRSFGVTKTKQDSYTLESFFLFTKINRIFKMNSRKCQKEVEYY